MKQLTKKLFAPLLFSLLTACGSGGGSPDTTKVCTSNCNGGNSSLNNQEWVWDKENYDSFAHQEMATKTLNWLDSVHRDFKRNVEFVGDPSDVDYVKLADSWNERYASWMDNYIYQVKPLIMNIYDDYAASTTPEQYLQNALDTIEIVKSRLNEEYEQYIVEKFAPYSDASDQLKTLDFQKPYIIELDTVAVEISMEIQ